MRDIPERDWKAIRELSQVALERFCQRILDEASPLVTGSCEAAMNCHERYLALFRLMHERDDQIAAAFNELCRSKAFFKLANMCRLKLLTDEELARFSQETRNRLQASLRFD